MDTRMVFGLLLIALLVAGCVGGNAGTKGAPSAATPTKSAAVEPTQTTNPSAKPAPSAAAPVAPAPAGNDLMATWQKLLAGKPQEYRVQYKMNMGSAGENLMEQYVKGGVQRRTDLKINQGGIMQDLRIFYLQGGETVTCMENTGKELCLKSGAEKAAQNPSQQYEVKNYEPKIEDFQLGQFTMTPEPARIIAGQATECYMVIYAKGKTAAMAFCYTSDGIAMYMESLDGENGFRMEALKLERSVADSDLVAPSAQSIEEMYGLPTAGQYG